MTDGKHDSKAGPRPIAQLIKSAQSKLPSRTEESSPKPSLPAPTTQLSLIPGQLEPNRARRKLLATQDLIFGTPADTKDAAYIAREIVQASLPHSDPGPVPAWVRKNGNVTLSIQPGFNNETGKSFGYPFGTIPRLLVFWVTTEAVRYGHKRLQMGSSMNDFVRKIGMDPSTGGGSRGDAARATDQMQRLFAAQFRLQRSDEVGDASGQGFHQMQIARRGYFWWSTTAPEQGALFDSWIDLSDEFFDAVTSSPVPVDMRALCALKRSPLALDLYAWLTYEAFRAHASGRPRYESWTQLHAHLGGNYTRMNNFSLRVKAAVKKIQCVYPGLVLGLKQGGIEILPSSLTAIQPKEPLAPKLRLFNSKPNK